MERDDEKINGNSEDEARAARQRLLNELRTSGKKSNFIVSDDDHEANDESRALRIAREFGQMDEEMEKEMRRGAIDIISMEIEKDDVIEEEDDLVRHEIEEKEVEVEVIDMRYDDGLKDFLRDDVKNELFGDSEDVRQGDTNRLTQCPSCGSNDVQVLSPPNMYCNSCDEIYSYEMGMEDIESAFDVEFKKDQDEEPSDGGEIIFGSKETNQKKIKRIFRPGE